MISAEASGHHHLQGACTGSVEEDAKLNDQKLNRIYDVFMPNEIYEDMENWVRSFKITPNISVKEAIWELGSHLPEDSQSILRLCYDKKIPIFCPAFTDSGLAMQFSFCQPNVKSQFL